MENAPRILTRLEAPWLSWIRALGAVGCGSAIALAFPPFSAHWLLFIAFLPLMLLPTPRRICERLLVGYLFGYSQFSLSLLWLNEVGFGAGWLLALWCALFPACWYLLLSAWNWQQKKNCLTFLPGAGPLFFQSHWQSLCYALFAASLWTALEFLRGVLLTGFPWNSLGVAFFQHPVLLRPLSVTGLSGISFFLLFFQAIAATILLAALRRWKKLPSPIGFPWHLGAALLLLLAWGWLILFPAAAAENSPRKHLRVALIQADYPPCRDYTEEQLLEMMQTYAKLTLLAASDPDIQLILWPESAFPVPADFYPLRVMRMKLLREIHCPLLLGAITDRSAAPASGTPGESPRLFNSALLYSPGPTVTAPTAIYDKQHLVPMGEYTPFSRQFPALARWFGMGADFTPGRTAVLFPLPGEIRAGMNICYEDAFPAISRQAVRQGAELLVTLTNDCWYGHSAGSLQHLAHIVCRAVENRRFALRSANNAHSCLIAPDGTLVLSDTLCSPRGSVIAREVIVESRRVSAVIPGIGRGCGGMERAAGPFLPPQYLPSRGTEHSDKDGGMPFLRNPSDHSPFVRGILKTTLSLPANPPMTFYTRHGDWPAYLSLLLSLIFCGIVIWKKWKFHGAALAAIQQASSR